MKECPVCGYHDRGKGKPRSIDQHRRFYGLVRKAFHAWPEKSEFQPESEDHLRQWLICAAGPQWRESATQEVPPQLRNEALAPFVDRFAVGIAKRTGKYPFPRLNTWTWKCTVYTARSIKFSEMPHLEFSALSNSVDEVIGAELGVEADALLKSEAA
jgi:hypothetical protein